MICFACKKDFEYDESYTGHDSEFYPDESIEQQKHQENHRCLESRIRINFIHLTEKIVTDSHIDGAIVFERLVDKILFVGIYSLYDRRIAGFLRLQGNVLSDNSDIFQFGIENCSGIGFDRSDRIRKKGDYTRGSI
jgi:hypothetical protein